MRVRAHKTPASAQSQSRPSHRIAPCYSRIVHIMLHCTCRAGGWGGLLLPAPGGAATAATAHWHCRPPTAASPPPLTSARCRRSPPLRPSAIATGHCPPPSAAPLPMGGRAARVAACAVEFGWIDLVTRRRSHPDGERHRLMTTNTEAARRAHSRSLESSYAVCSEIISAT